MTNLALAFTDIRDGTVSGAVQPEGLFSRFHTVRFIYERSFPIV